MHAIITKHALIRTRGRFPQLSDLPDHTLRGILRGVFYNSKVTDSVMVGHDLRTGVLRDGTTVRMVTVPGDMSHERIITTVFAEGMDIPEERKGLRV